MCSSAKFFLPCVVHEIIVYVVTVQDDLAILGTFLKVNQS